MSPHTPHATLSPYTTLFRSAIDENNYLYVYGRADAVIRRPGGAWIAPFEIEDVLDALPGVRASAAVARSEEHTSELQSPDHLVCRLLHENKKKQRESTQTEM